MRTLIKRSLLVGAVAFSSVAAVTPGQAIGGGPVSGGQIALSGGLDVGAGLQRQTPPSSTRSTSHAVSRHRSHAARPALPR
jgi:hypothetical protein